MPLAQPHRGSCTHASGSTRTSISTSTVAAQSFGPTVQKCSPRHVTVATGAVKPAKLLRQCRAGATPRTDKQPARKERDELLDLLLLDGPSSAAHAAELVEVLASTQMPFEEALLGGGPWQVIYTKGGAQLWKATWQAGKLLNSNNRASQEFGPDGRLAYNKAEYFGGQVFVTASGTYEPQGDCVRTPQTIRADIQRGSLHLFGLELPLPIRGSGTFEVLWLDDTLRVFKSRTPLGDAYSVQVRQDRLPALLQAAQQKRNAEQ